MAGPVQQKYNYKNYSTNHPVVFDGTPANGNTLVCLVASDSNTITVSSITGGGVTWSKQKSNPDASSNCNLEIWAGAGVASGGATITVTLSGGGGAASVNISEWLSIQCVATLDGSNATVGRSVSASAGSITPTAGKTMVIFSVGLSTGPTYPVGAPSNSFVEMNTDGDIQSFAYLEVASASGSYSTTWTSPHSYDFWNAIIAGLDATGGAATVGMVPRRNRFRQRTNVRTKHRPHLFDFPGVLIPERPDILLRA